jgi:hypothetical protein
MVRLGFAMGERGWASPDILTTPPLDHPAA